MFSVLFGLSMDYEVCRVSRMQEEWQRLRSRPEDPAWRNHGAVTAGQAHSIRIVTDPMPFCLRNRQSVASPLAR